MAQELSKDDVLIRLDDFVVNVNGTPEVEVDVDGRQSTVEPRPVYDFERDILDDVIGSTISGGNSGAAIPVKGRWIHGWLRENTDEYINGLWRNYQFFLKYLQAETTKIENMSAFNKAPGTYESMYRYILVLEDIGLVDRYRREEVPESEYDFNVPEEFRRRTFVRLKASYDDNKQLWNNPIGSEYGDVEAEDVDQFMTFSDESDEEEVTDEEDGDELEEVIDEIESDDESTSVDVEDIHGDISAEENIKITDLDDIKLLPPYLNGIEEEIIKESLEDDPLNRDFDASSVEFKRIAVIGKWANDGGTKGEDELFLFTSIKEKEDGLGDINKPKFLPPSISNNIAKKLNEEQPFDGLFAGYEVETVYNSEFKSELKRLIRTEQLGTKYYSFKSDEIIDIDD